MAVLSPAQPANRLKQAYTSSERAALIRRILQLGLVGAGTGVAARSVLGLRNIARGPVHVPFISPGPSTLPVPVLRYADEDENLQKTAAGLHKLADGIAEVIAGALPESETMFDAARIPLGVGVAGGGVLGGWKLTDWLLKRRRASRLQDEMRQAKQEYQAALLDQFRNSHKLAAAQDATGAALDELYDLVSQIGSGAPTEKQAMSPTSAALGAYLTSLGLITGGAGYGVYNWAKNRSDAELLDKAMKERARRLWARSPQPVLAVPQEVPVRALQAA